LECDRDQVLSLPPRLRERGHWRGFVIDAVELLDLTAFYVGYRLDGQGRAPHEPSMMVALLLDSYPVGERSSRLRGGCGRARDLRQPGYPITRRSRGFVSATRPRWRNCSARCCGYVPRPVW
jgi:hypothetical protein